MKDFLFSQKQRAAELKRKGYRLIADNTGIDEAVIKARRKEWPTKTLWLPALQEAYAPPADEQELREAAE